MSEGFKVPILFIGFNRPDASARVFEVFKKLKPEKLYVAVDGPRAGNTNDTVFVGQVKVVFNNIDWKCNLNTHYRENNLGCKLGVSDAINWFFSHEEEGIIIEDDSLADISFFHFSQYLLNKYRNVESVYMITGHNRLGKYSASNNASYFFSGIACAWGWATWRRAWQQYDISMSQWEKAKSEKLFYRLFGYNDMAQHFESAVDDVYNNKLNTWDYIWIFDILRNNGLVIVPNINLVKNLGLNETGTHAWNQDHIAPSILEQYSLDTDNIVDPAEIKLDEFYDLKVYKEVTTYSAHKGLKGLFKRIRASVKYRLGI